LLRSRVRFIFNFYDAPECQGVPTVRRRPAILGQLPDGANLSQLDEASRNGVEGALAEARTNASTPSSAAPSTKAKSYAMLLCVAEQKCYGPGRRSQPRFLRNEPNLKNLHQSIAARTGQHNPLDVQSDAPVIAAPAGATYPSWRGRLRSLSHNRRARVSGSHRQRRN